MTENPEQEYQQLFYTYYSLRMQLESSMNALTQIQNVLDGISISNSVIQELEGKKKNHEIILPIGNFAYIKAKISNPDKILISIGRKTLVERDTKQALDFIRKKRDELQKQEDILKKTLEETSAKLQELEPLLAQYEKQGFKPPQLL